MNNFKKALIFSGFILCGFIAMTDYAVAANCCALTLPSGGSGCSPAANIGWCKDLAIDLGANSWTFNSPGICNGTICEPFDECPDDPNKTSPGICGCGTPDTDSDGDGTPDCNDGCPNDPNKTSPGTCGCGEPETDPCDPTVVTLTSFIATVSDGKVELKWETASEIDNAGFNIWRSETEAGEYVKITDNLIPAQGSDYQYSFTDDAVVKGNTYYYKLEDIDLYGVATFHGPVSARMPNNSFLPILQFLLRDQ